MDVTRLLKAVLPMLIALVLWELFLKDLITGKTTP